MASPQRNPLEVRIERILFPECASSLRPHDNCPGVAVSTHGFYEVHCPCDHHRLADAHVHVCPGCNQPRPLEIVDETPADGLTPESYALRYCKDCRDSFLSEMRGAK